jgi:hypothetical protein
VRVHRSRGRGAHRQGRYEHSTPDPLCRTYGPTVRRARGASNGIASTSARRDPGSQAIHARCMGGAEDRIALRHYLGRDCPIRRQAIAAQPSGPREARSRAREFPRAGLDGDNDRVRLKDSASPPFFGFQGVHMNPLQSSGRLAVSKFEAGRHRTRNRPAAVGLGRPVWVPFCRGGTIFCLLRRLIEHGAAE